VADVAPDCVQGTAVPVDRLQGNVGSTHRMPGCIRPGPAERTPGLMGGTGAFFTLFERFFHVFQRAIQ
jgi:hypothetical protein